MAQTQGALDAETLRARLHYDPSTGVFTWRISQGRAPAGARAGGFWKGYVGIRVGGRKYFAHRLAYLYMTGAWPPGDIDHRDMDRLNNRWSNLRSATRSQNKANCTLRSDNTTGFKGVSFFKQTSRYHAKIEVRGKHLHLGFFETPEAAHAAYAAAAKHHFGEFARAA